MFSDEDLKKLQALLCQWENPEDKTNQTRDEKENKKSGNASISLTPSQLLVIAGLVSGVLNVESLFITRDQAVQIVLVGSLRRPTPMEKTMEQIGKLPFNQVVKHLLK